MGSDDPRARTAQRHGSRRRRRLGRAGRAARPPRARPRARRRDRHRRARIRRHARDRAATGPARQADARAVRGGAPRVPPGAPRRSARAASRARGDAAQDRERRRRRLLPRPGRATRSARSRRSTPDDLAVPHAEWVEPLRKHYRGVEVCEIPPNGQGVAALQALGILAGLDHTGGRALDRVHLQAEAMKLAFADAERHVHDGPLPARYLDDDYLASRRALIDPARAGAPAAGRAAARRHGLPVRGGRAAQRVLADPERLRRLRLARRGARHRRRAAEPRPLLHARARAPQPAGPGQAPVPHDHPGPAAARRRPARPVRRDGRPHAAAGPPAGRLAHGRPRPRPPGGARRAALAARPRRARRLDAGSRGAAAPPRAGARATRAPRAVRPRSRTASAAGRPCSCATTC